MINAFREKMRFLTGNSPEPEGSKKHSILAAVSGGIDSMVMAQLLFEMGENDLSVATVNFKLRGKESDLDEKHVRDWCSERNIRFFSKSFDTNEYSQSRGISVEMAARELRYSWFDSLIKEFKFEFLAVAHNLNDNVETLFINLLRGTGIDGLSGIREKSGYIIRPMLGFTREEITRHAIRNHISYRVDKTNLETDYSRNRIRNLVFPELEKINPSFLRRINENMVHFSDASALLDSILTEARKRLCTDEPEKGIILAIPVRELLSEPSPRFLIFNFFKDYGFNERQAGDIFQSLTSTSGKHFFAGDYCLVRDRERLILTKDQFRKSSLNEQIVYLDDPLQKEVTYHFKGRTIILRRFSYYTGFSPLKSSEQIQYLDAALLSFPLICRSRRRGDKFIPLGMKGFKKLSDLFTDQKMDSVSKELQPVLLSGDKIVCLPGLRSDERFRLRESTVSVLEIRLL
ncbi:MAG: tRNA lysidine(34) synthetase TilS [Bacteroidales bacterium]|nr:tRNA lysidine(34) synthetase TilS [Bacteroidales bacterium]